MIVAFSTSSPQVSVAVIDADGKVLCSVERDAPQAASGAALDLLQVALGKAERELSEAELFVADLGPGSFTGVRVGVTVAKVLGYAMGRKVAGINAFDLVSPTETVVLPSKRGEFFVREPGSAPHRVNHLPEGAFVGYGKGVATPRFPHAEGFADLIRQLTPVEPEELNPAYLVEPSISKPNKPYGLGGVLG